MNDTIYRQDAIDAIMTDKIEGKALDILIALGEGNQAKTLNEACDRHAQLLRDLPFAQSELAQDLHNACTDAISRQAVKEWLAKWEGYIDADMIARMQYRVIDIPSAQPDRSLWFRIGEICVDESKGFISSGRAVEKIRELLKEAERREDG